MGWRCAVLGTQKAHTRSHLRLYPRPACTSPAAARRAISLDLQPWIPWSERHIQASCIDHDACPGGRPVD